ncbi:MAG: hypothetical protein ACTSU2_07540 [Promethearchaeota archaeon]
MGTFNDNEDHKDGSNFLNGSNSGNNEEGVSSDSGNPQISDNEVVVDNDLGQIIENEIDKIPLKKEGEKVKIDTEALWNEVGFHRITGGIFYSYVLLIVGAIVGLFTVTIIAEFLPYPEINGYKNMTATLLGFWFGLLDLNLGGGGGLSDGMNRFIGQYADTNPERALEYVRFYIWFQMWTGIVQVTAISIVMFTYFVHTNLAYLTWFILAQSMVQYPGMLMIMEATLKSFQRGDKTAWLSWLQDTVFQVSVNIVFLIIGKYWGSHNPVIGELMGITIMYILSQFMDDWINLIVGGFMFSHVLKSRGIDRGVLTLFVPKFDKEVIREALTFTGKQWIGGQVTGLISYMINLFLIVKMPQMASFTGLMLIPSFLGHLVSMINWGSPTVPAISEAYNNGKKELAQYFVHDLFKYYIFTTLWMAVPLIVLTPRMLTMVMNISFVKGLGNYEAGLVMIPIFMIRDSMSNWRGIWQKIFIACDKPMPPIYVNWIFTIPGYAFQFLFIYLCIDLQIMPMWYVLIIPGFLNDTLKAIVGYIWLQKTTLPIDYKKISWQVFIAPLLTAFAYAIVLYLFQITLWPLMDLIMYQIMGEMGYILDVMIILLGILFIFPGIFYAPFYALFGGWDEFTIEEFRKTAVISGPSKFVMMVLYKISNKFHKLSKWANKYPIADYDIVKKQVAELVAEGKAFKLLKKK